jgi:hypothetical protein
LFSPTAPDAVRRPATAMLGCVMAAYVIAAAGGVGLPTVLAFIALLACTGWALTSVRDPRAAWMLVTVAVLMAIALGSPSDEWDPRSIWLFHAKRIYVDGSLYAMLDGYAAFSHNDYPALLPLLSATAAKLVGHWNELFPKAVGTLLLLPALLLIARSLRAWWVAALFALVTLQIGGTYLVDGYMDAVLAVYAVASLATAARCLSRWNALSWPDLLPYVLATAVLSLIKNEGMVLAGVIAVAMIAAVLLRERRVPWGLVVAFAVALLPLLAWKLAVAGAHLTNDLAASDLKGQLLARLPDFSNSLLILKKLLRGWALVPLLMLLVLWKRSWRTPVVLGGMLAGLAYAGVLYAVYLGTPHDLDWHLATSVKRTVLPVFLLLTYALLVLMDRWKEPDAA